MTDKIQLHSYTSLFPPAPVSPTQTRPKPMYDYDEKPRKPDWLVLLISALVLLTLLIGWLVDIPGLLS